MATNKPIISVVLDDETLKKIENYQFENRFRSRSKALNEIIEIGLNVIENESNKQ